VRKRYPAFVSLQLQLLLLQAKSNVHAENKLGSTALRLAVEFDGNFQRVSNLLAAGADVNAMSASHEMPIVAEAMRNRLKDVTELLLRSRADVHAIGTSGKTVLQYAFETEALPGMSPRITALVLATMNGAGRAFAAQARAARAQYVDKHWTNHRLFDINLVDEITQYVAYDRNSVAPRLKQPLKM
jgi:hypothetical protein